MRTYLPELACLVPESVTEALAQQAAHEHLVPIAGGTDVLVWMNAGKMPARMYQSLHRLAPEWRYVRPDADGGLRIGALATYSDVRNNPTVASDYPMLVESARVTGAIQIQNRGTLAGNIANASPAADTVPVLMVYDARLRLASASGDRWVELASFYRGYKKTVMGPGELIAEIHLPPPRFPAREQYYRKVGTREAQAISKVVFAGARGTAGVRMAWGSVGPCTVRSVKTEAALEAGLEPVPDAWMLLQDEIGAIDDIRSTRDYRMGVARNILIDFFERTRP